VTLTFKEAAQMLHATRRLNMVIISVKLFRNLTLNTSYGPDMIFDFAARSCCDLDLQDSNTNIARDMLSQYGDNFCEIVWKSDFKKPSHCPDTILLQGHAVTLTFKVATQIFARHVVSIC